MAFILSQILGGIGKMYNTYYGTRNYRYTVENARGGSIAEFDSLDDAKKFLKSSLNGYAIYDNMLNTTILWK